MRILFTSYTGDHAITFSGANDAPDGTHPRVKDKNNADVNFGVGRHYYIHKWCCHHRHVTLQG